MGELRMRVFACYPSGLSARLFREVVDFHIDDMGCVVDEENALQVVDFVLERLGEYAPAPALEFLSLRILRTHGCALRALRLPVLAADRQASLVHLASLSGLSYEFWIHVYANLRFALRLSLGL
jgi:hypothetical protein